MQLQRYCLLTMAVFLQGLEYIGRKPSLTIVEVNIINFVGYKGGVYTRLLFLEFLF